MKRRTLFLILTVILLFASNSLFSFSKKEVQIEEPIISAKYNKIDPMSAKEVFDTQKDITIIDVRTAGEFESGHIEKSINIPLDVIEATVLEKYPNKDEKLYLYCRSGNRSAQAAKLLVNQGYTNVYDFGGIISWPYEVVK